MHVIVFVMAKRVLAAVSGVAKLYLFKCHLYVLSQVQTPVFVCMCVCVCL